MKFTRTSCKLVFLEYEDEEAEEAIFFEQIDTSLLFWKIRFALYKCFTLRVLIVPPSINDVQQLFGACSFSRDASFKIEFQTKFASSRNFHWNLWIVQEIFARIQEIFAFFLNSQTDKEKKIKMINVRCEIWKACFSKKWTYFSQPFIFYCSRNRETLRSSAI